MAEAPHGTAPSLEGKNVANPMAMLLACAAVLEHAGIQGDERAGEASRTLRRRRSRPRWTAFVALILAARLLPPKSSTRSWPECAIAEEVSQRNCALSSGPRRERHESAYTVEA